MKIECELNNNEKIKKMTEKNNSKTGRKINREEKMK